MNLVLPFSVFLINLVFSAPVLSDQGLPILDIIEEEGSTRYSLTLQLLGLMTVLTLLPSIVIMMTSFVRIVVVLSLLRQALGTAQTPPNQVIIGISLFLTFFIMAPVFNEIYNESLVPYQSENISFETAIMNAEKPIRNFMLNQTRKEDISMFVQISNSDISSDLAETPFSILAPAFITSELKSAFIIGFLIYIPFVIIDLVVASVLMSMGMMMLSPMMISMPFKLMLFVLVDGWTLIMGSLSSSFVS